MPESDKKDSPVQNRAGEGEQGFGHGVKAQVVGVAAVYRAVTLGVFHEGGPVHKIYIPVTGGKGLIIGASNDFQPLLFLLI